MFSLLNMKDVKTKTFRLFYLALWYLFSDCMTPPFVKIQNKTFMVFLPFQFGFTRDRIYCCLRSKFLPSRVDLVLEGFLTSREANGKSLNFSLFFYYKIGDQHMDVWHLP